MRIAFTAPKQEDMSWMGVFAWGPHFDGPFLGPLPAPWKDLIGRSVTGQLSRATFKPLPTSLVRGDAVSFKNSDTLI